MLNMLIAIMGDTFGRVTENKVVEALRTKLEFLVDYAFYLQQFKDVEDENKVYLFGIFPADGANQESSSAWQGSISKIEFTTRRTVGLAKSQILEEIADFKAHQEQ